MCIDPMGYRAWTLPAIDMDLTVDDDVPEGS
jgi:hypothetical protein